MFVGDEVMHEMLSHPFLRGESHIFAAQFIEDDLIALFELGPSGSEIRIVEEKHYRLVPADKITQSELRSYDA